MMCSGSGRSFTHFNINDTENQRAVRFLLYAYSEMGREDDASKMQEKESHELDGFHPRVSNPDVWQAWAFADRGDFESARAPSIPPVGAL